MANVIKNKLFLGIKQDTLNGYNSFDDEAKLNYIWFVRDEDATSGATYSVWLGDTKYGETNGNYVTEEEFDNIIDILRDRIGLDENNEFPEGISEDLATEIISLKSSVDTLNTSLNNEVERATEAEEGLQSNIDVETERATNAETTLNTAIENLQDNIDEVNSSLTESIQTLEDEVVDDEEVLVRSILSVKDLIGITKNFTLPDAVFSYETVIDGINDRYTKTEVYTKEEVNRMVAGAFHFRGVVEILDDLESISGQSEGDVYIVNFKNEEDKQAGIRYDAEYAWNGDEWIELGPLFDTRTLEAKLDEIIEKVDNSYTYITTTVPTNGLIDTKTNDIINTTNSQTNGINANINGVNANVNGQAVAIINTINAQATAINNTTNAQAQAIIQHNINQTDILQQRLDKVATTEQLNSAVNNVIVPRFDRIINEQNVTIINYLSTINSTLNNVNTNVNTINAKLDNLKIVTDEMIDGLFTD